jgi:hypothetical protein
MYDCGHGFNASTTASKVASVLPDISPGFKAKIREERAKLTHHSPVKNSRGFAVQNISNMEVTSCTYNQFLTKADNLTNFVSKFFLPKT